MPFHFYCKIIPANSRQSDVVDSLGNLFVLTAFVKQGPADGAPAKRPRGRPRKAPQTQQPKPQPSKRMAAHKAGAAQSDSEEEEGQPKQQPSEHGAAHLNNAAHFDNEEARPAAKRRVTNPSRLQRAALMPIDEDEGAETGQVRAFIACLLCHMASIPASWCMHPDSFCALCCMIKPPQPCF